MSFINLLIDKPRILFLTLSFILLAGISSAISIPIQENPELAQRWSGVRVFYPGASPERIETQIVNELEIKLREVEEIKELDSIICISAPKSLRIERVKARDGLKNYEINNRMKNQFSQEEKENLSDYIIVNDKKD